MTLSVPNLRGLAERNNGIFPRDSVREYIDGRRSPQAHGDRYMPVWGDEFRAMENGDERAGDTRIEQATGGRIERAANARIEALTAFIASIQYSAGR
jgi:hypothetical protein